MLVTGVSTSRVPDMIAGAQRTATLSRRVFVTVGAGLLLGSGKPVAARQASAGTPVAEGAGWSFAYDHGTTISLPKRPERIVAYIGSAATLWDYGIHPVGVVGPLRREDGQPNPLAGNIDVDAVVSLGETYNEIDLEALVALEPDLVISTTYSPDIPGDLWGLESDVAAQVAQIAPVLAISAFETPVDASLARFEELAAALGADLTAPSRVAARERFAAASADVHAVAAANPGLSVLVMSAWPEAIYIANPPGGRGPGLFRVTRRPPGSPA